MVNKSRLILLAAYLTVISIMLGCKIILNKIDDYEKEEKTVMYKGKIFTWILILISVVGVNSIFSAINSIEPKPTINVYCESNNLEFNQNILGIDGGGANWKFVTSKNEADVIIIEHSNTTLPGYTKYENYIYTPLVMYMIGAHFDKTLSVGTIDTNRGLVYTKDFSTILLAFEENKSYADIGMMNLEGDIKITIPNKTSILYPKVEELFYIALGGSYTDKDTNTDLTTRVETLLNKCTQTDDILTQIIPLATSGYKKNPKDTIFIGCESIAIEHPHQKGNSAYRYFNIMDGNDDDAYDIVYIPNGVSYQFDIFIRTVETTTKNGEPKVYSVNDILQMIYKSSFSTKTSYRLLNDNALYNDNHHIIKTIN